MGSVKEQGEGEKGEKEEKERKYIPVLMRAEEARYIDHIKEKLLFIICMNKEKCREKYGRKITKTDILGSLVMMAFFNEDILMELAKRVAIFDEYTYTAVMSRVKEYEEQKKKREEEKRAKEETSKPRAITVQCPDPQKCLQEMMEEAKEFRRMMGLED
jgi:ABC-type transport system involved in cytochrome bd biosynthesis fused ATPase/permease subunit